MTWRQRWVLVLVLLVAAGLRLTGLDWDDYHHYHPDERYITWVATTVEWPADWRMAWEPAASTFNPYYWPEQDTTEGVEVLRGERRDFAYGHLPLYLGVAATRVVEAIPAGVRTVLPDSWLLTQDILNAREAIEFRHLTAVTRALTAVVDTGTVLLVFVLGRRLFGVASGLLAAAFLALTPLHIQLAHFFAVDPYMTFFVVATVTCLVLALPEPSGETEPGRRHRLFLLLAAVCLGLAVGSKFAAMLLLVPLIVALWLERPFRNRSFAFWLFLLGAVALLTFALTNPFALLDRGCQVSTAASSLGPLQIPRIEWGFCFLENVIVQGEMVRGTLDVDFGRQYTDTLPFLYNLEMLVRWGMGWLLGLLAIAGFGWAVVRGVWAAAGAYLPAGPAGFQRAEWVVLAWAVPYFLITGTFFVKFMRYMQPLTPFLAIYAAEMVWHLRPVWLRWVAVGATLLLTAVYTLAFVNMYGQTHPWTAASRWIFENAPAGSLILSERWDQPLPASVKIDGELHSRLIYEAGELTWLTGADERDDVPKLEANVEQLAAADFVVISSNRTYGVVPRLPQRYPLTSQYHALLFVGRLGYEPVYVAGRFPELFGFYLLPDTFSWPGLEPPQPVAELLASLPGVNGGRADESFLVYDQPLTIIFANTGRLTAEEMLTQFDLDRVTNESR